MERGTARRLLQVKEEPFRLTWENQQSYLQAGGTIDAERLFVEGLQPSGEARGCCGSIRETRSGDLPSRSLGQTMVERWSTAAERDRSKEQR
jgi:hypothetical protein